MIAGMRGMVVTVVAMITMTTLNGHSIAMAGTVRRMIRVDVDISSVSGSMITIMVRAHTHPSGAHFDLRQ